MKFYQAEERGIVHWSVRKIGTQRDKRHDRASRLCHSGYQQIEKATSLLFGERLGEEFLELVDDEHHSGVRRLCSCPLQNLCGKQVQPTRRVVFQVLTNRLHAPLREKTCERERERLKRTLPRNHGLQVDPVLAAGEGTNLKLWK